MERKTTRSVQRHQRLPWLTLRVRAFVLTIPVTRTRLRNKNRRENPKAVPFLTPPKRHKSERRTVTTAEEEQAQTRLLPSSALDLVVLVRPAVRLRGTGEP